LILVYATSKKNSAISEIDKKGYVKGKRLEMECLLCKMFSVFTQQYI